MPRWAKQGLSVVPLIRLPVPHEPPCAPFRRSFLRSADHLKIFYTGASLVIDLGHSIIDSFENNTSEKEAVKEDTKGDLEILIGAVIGMVPAAYTEAGGELLKQIHGYKNLPPSAHKNLLAIALTFAGKTGTHTLDGIVDSIAKRIVGGVFSGLSGPEVAQTVSE